MIIRISAVVAVAAAVGVGLIRPGVPSAEPAVYRFLLAWQSRDYLQAAELTTGPPAAVAKALAGAYKELDATDLSLSMHRISQQDRTAYAEFTASVSLGSTGLTWTYRGTFTLRDGSSGWRVQWSPSVIVPGMSGAERLAVVTSVPPRQPILDAAGHSLAVRSTAYEVGVYPEKLTDPERTSAGLAAVTHIPADQIEGQISTAPSAGFLELLTLSPGDYASMRGRLAAIPGVLALPEDVQLFDSIAPDVVGTVGTETASVLREDGAPYRPGTTVGESGLQQAFQRQLIGTPQTQVVLLNRAGQPQDVLKTWPWTQGQAVHTTLDSQVQLAADNAIGQLPNSAAVVAVQASTGRILAVASHTAAGQPSLDPLAGHYQPGQAFTIVSSSAILKNGVTPASPVLCTQSNAVNGRDFVNDPPEQFLARSTTFRKVFAYACATAFVGLSEPLSTTDLTQAAEAFGIGGWQLPIGSYAGNVGQPSGVGTVAADSIGTGDVRVSPLGMALAAAVADSGKWHAPSLVTGFADPSSARRAAESPQVLSMLRTLMRTATTTGSAKAANVGGNVYGQVGNVPFGTSHGLRLSWFVGYQGDIAFAVVELGNSPYDSAAPLAGTFLQNIQTRS